jgi:hypothetical protein
VSGRTIRRVTLLGIAGTLVLALLPAAPAAGGAGVTSRVVARHLLNPRGLVLAGGGAFYVAEAGKGGTGPCLSGPEGGEVCVGRTGHVTWIHGGARNRLVRLPSNAAPDGSFALGPHDVGVANSGALYATVGLGGDAAHRAAFGPKGRRFGTLVRIGVHGHVSVVADLTGYEETHNPDGAQVDSDPYGVLRQLGRTLVTDAGGNDLLRVRDDGHVSTIAVFPTRNVPFDGGIIPMDAVPTTIDRGPDGALYVGQLTGFPFPLHGARVYRIGPGGQPEIFARGFTNIIDIAWHGGSLYVLEIAHNSLLDPAPFGALLRLNPDGSKTVLFDDLFFPGSFAFTGRNRVLVTNCGICPGGGEVLELHL